VQHPECLLIASGSNYAASSKKLCDLYRQFAGTKVEAKLLRQSIRVPSSAGNRRWRHWTFAGVVRDVEKLIPEKSAKVTSRQDAP